MNERELVTHPVTIAIPAYIDPAALQPGHTVYLLLEQTRTPLEVLRVEPYLVCRAPDGSQLVIPAHAVTLEP